MRIFRLSTCLCGVLAIAAFAWPAMPAAQAPPQTPQLATAATAVASTTPDFVIGPDDVLAISVWRDKDLSGEVVVRPDGKISLPLINDIQAAGLTAEELRVKIAEALKKSNLYEDPTVGVVVRQINSRKVFITGQVTKPGTYQLSDHMTVIQLVAMAGGLLDYADRKNIVVVSKERRPDGSPWSYKVNYDDLTDRKNLKQNIELKPGDTVIVK